MTDIFDVDRIYFPDVPEMRVFGTIEKLVQWRHRMCGAAFFRIGRWIGYNGTDLNGHLRAHRLDPNEVAL